MGMLLLQVATLVKADWLFLLTDVDGLYTANPTTHPEALHIPEVHDITKLQVGFQRFSILGQMSGSVPTSMHWYNKHALLQQDICTKKQLRSVLMGCTNTVLWVVNNCDLAG